MIFILQLSFYLNIQLTNQIIKDGGGIRERPERAKGVISYENFKGLFRSCLSGIRFEFRSFQTQTWCLVEFFLLQTHTSNLQGMRFSYPRGGVGMKHGFEESTCFLLFSFLFISLNSNY